MQLRQILARLLPEISAAHLRLQARPVEIAPGEHSGCRVGLRARRKSNEKNQTLIEEIGEQRFNHWILLGRVGVVDEVADTALFLVSDLSRYVTGTTLTVDGAYSNHLVRYTEKPT